MFTTQYTQNDGGRAVAMATAILTVFMSYFLPLFVKLLTFLVGFELTTPDDLLSIDSNTLPLCHGRLRTCIVICIFIFKFALIFLNSEHSCM